MASSQLSTGSASGVQSTTQSPQAATGSGNTTTAGSSVQPGTATSVLTSGSGSENLHPTVLPSFTLGSASGQTSTAPAKQTTNHHINYGLFGISALLFVFAIALFWYTGRSAKSTTI